MRSGSTVLREARGRTIKEMRVVYDEEYCAVEIDFDDGYAVGVDIGPAVQIRPQFLHVATGDTEVLRNYKARIHTMGLIVEGK